MIARAGCSILLASAALAAVMLVTREGGAGELVREDFSPLIPQEVVQTGGSPTAGTHASLLQDLPKLLSAKKSHSEKNYGPGWSKVTGEELKQILKKRDNSHLNDASEYLAQSLLKHRAVNKVHSGTDATDTLRAAARKRRDAYANTPVLCADKEACESLERQEVERWRRIHKKTLASLSNPRVQQHLAHSIREMIGKVVSNETKVSSLAGMINHEVSKVRTDSLKNVTLEVKNWQDTALKAKLLKAQKAGKARWKAIATKAKKEDAKKPNPAAVAYKKTAKAFKGAVEKVKSTKTHKKAFAEAKKVESKTPAAKAKTTNQPKANATAEAAQANKLFKAAAAKESASTVSATKKKAVTKQDGAKKAAKAKGAKTKKPDVADKEAVKKDAKKAAKAKDTKTKKPDVADKEAVKKDAKKAAKAKDTKTKKPDVTNKEPFERFWSDSMEKDSLKKASKKQDDSSQQETYQVPTDEKMGRAKPMTASVLLQRSAARNTKKGNGAKVAADGATQAEAEAELDHFILAAESLLETETASSAHGGTASSAHGALKKERESAVHGKHESDGKAESVGVSGADVEELRADEEEETPQNIKHATGQEEKVDADKRKHLTEQGSGRQRQHATHDVDRNALVQDSAASDFEAAKLEKELHKRNTEVLTFAARAHAAKEDAAALQRSLRKTIDELASTRKKMNHGTAFGKSTLTKAFRRVVEKRYNKALDAVELHEIQLGNVKSQTQHVLQSLTKPLHVQSGHP